MDKDKVIPLGSLTVQEYEMLRETLRWARKHCDAEAEYLRLFRDSDARLWRSRAAECRALLARFGKSGRKK